MILIVQTNAIKEIYQKMRNIIYRFYYILYQSEYLAEKISPDYYAIDESFFTHDKNGRQIQVIGIINNVNKDFRLEASIRRDTDTIKKFLLKFIDSNNRIISDGWTGYNFIRNFNGYSHEVHNHGADFGEGLHTTSQIESLWSALKSQIKNAYHVIPGKYFISFLREAEWKIKNKNKSYDSFIQEFFDCYEYINNLSDIILEDNSFLSDDELDDIDFEISSEDEENI